MKSKEAIRKDIIHYANLTWDTPNINNLNPLVHLMIEEISHELYLLDNKLDDIGYCVLNKLVSNLSPSMYNYIRPAHAILKINPGSPTYKLGRKINFFLKDLPDRVKKKNISSITFTPVVDTKLFDINITHFFCDRTLWSVNDFGEKNIIAYTQKRAKYNTVWIGLEVGPGINSLKDLSFYLDFKHLPDHHEYYDFLSDIGWTINNKILKTKQGLSVNQDIPPSKIETEILNFYKDHFQTIDTIPNLNEIQKEILPQELMKIMDNETVSSIHPLYWVSVSFPANFVQDDLMKMDIHLNAFPIINRHQNELTILEQDLTDTASLSSAIGQEFLDMDTVIDSKENRYLRVNIISEEGEYTAEAIKRKTMDDPRIADYLERLVDVIHDERSAFVGIDNEKIANVLKSVSSIQGKDTHKVELNRLNEYAEVALLTVKPNDDITSIDASYWTTHAELVNAIPDKTYLMASKILELNKSDGILLTPTSGGRNFYNPESLKAISRFFLTSKDRILTKNDILNFCNIELGEYTQQIDVERKAMISHKHNEGIIIVMEIQITPLQKHLNYLKQKGVIKDLLVRLRKRSPSNFNYVFNIIESANK
ncbi:type VI secretion system baseplate subunit TssF [Dysgonomonas sp. ZJ279]|uniref:type VI secretion system baseplate subunit TssF n=1 Tax=Dysgonomonas sp. ZJ279 TaxID=2709796 RepID=UPI0013EAAF94|nr:type VI secretion system baseplate subunit TssF [Dysgonomonas sp. ZJ279]